MLRIGVSASDASIQPPGFSPTLNGSLKYLRSCAIVSPWEFQFDTTTFTH
jgi:hypothetical protein